MRPTAYGRDARGLRDRQAFERIRAWRRVSNQQLHRIDQALWQGARAHGFDTDHWTLARVAIVIERLTGVSYHPGHVWKLLRHRLDGRGSRHTVTGKAEEV